MFFLVWFWRLQISLKIFKESCKGFKDCAKAYMFKLMYTFDILSILYQFNC